MTMQRLLAAVTGVILGMSTLAGGPAALVGNGIPTAKAQSASALVANVLGLMQATPVNQASVNAAISAAIAAGGPGIVASLVLTAAVGSSGNTPNPALAQAATAALLQVAASGNDAAKAAVGAGLGKAAATLTSAGQTGIAGSISTAAAATGGTVATTAAAAQSGTISVVVPSPAQVCSGASCN